MQVSIISYLQVQGASLSYIYRLAPVWKIKSDCLPLQHPKTDDKRLPMADKEHHPKSFLNRYGTILRWIKEICNQGDRFARDKPQADHPLKFERSPDYYSQGFSFYKQSY